MFICICTIVTTGILVFLLVIPHSMKKRTREIGILMSLGVTEKEIEAAIARGEQNKASEMAKNQKTRVEPPEELNTRIGVRSVLIEFIVMILIIKTGFHTGVVYD